MLLQHTPSGTQRITHTQKHNSFSAEGVLGPATLTAANTHTHVHTLTRPGTCEPRAGTTWREESDRIRLARARPQGGTTDALCCQDSGLHCLEVRRGSHTRDCSRLSSVSSPREDAGTRVRDQSRPVRACGRLRTQSPSHRLPAVDYISHKAQGEGVNFTQRASRSRPFRVAQLPRASHRV